MSTEPPVLAPSGGTPSAPMAWAAVRTGLAAAVPPSLSFALVWMMNTALLISLAGFWRQTLNPTGIAILAGAAALVGAVGYRYPGVTLGSVWALLMAVLGLTPQVHSLLVRQWDITTLSQAAKMAANTSAQIVELGLRIRAGHIETMPAATAWIFLGLAGLAAALFITREACLKGSMVRSLAAGAVLFGFQWLLHFDKAQDTLFAFLLAGWMLWALARWRQQTRDWQAGGWQVKSPPQWSSGVALALAVALAASWWPGELDPLTNLGPAAEEMRQTMPWLLRLRGVSGPATGIGAAAFSLGTTGFGDPSLLGGPIQPDDRPALKVRSPRPLNGSLYLRGAVETYYSGRGWSPVEGRALSRVRTGTALPGSYPAPAIASVLELEITPLQLSTRSLFFPLELARVDGLRETVWADAFGNLTLDRVLPTGRMYRMESRVATGDTERIKTLQPGGATVGPEMAPYLELPLSLPDRVRRLARTVVRGVADPVDQARAIETYLRTRYPYRLDVPTPNRNRDFVDQFLFGTRAGYCTYFSSAMVVMLRELGIPARWVQGFAVPGGSQLEVTVTSANAHAWVEAYFPGYGWVTFDPTPLPNLAAISRQAEPESPSTSDPASDDLPEDDPTASQGPDKTPEQADFLADPATDPASPGQGALLAAILSLLMTAVGLWWWAQRQWRPYDPRAALQVAFVRLQRLLQPGAPGGLTPSPRPHTPREFAAALADQYPDLAALVVPVAAEYERLRYGPPDWAPDPDRLRQAWELLRQARKVRRRVAGA